MATADDIATAISTATTVLKTLTASPNPTITINGETIDFSGYLTAMTQSLPVLLELQQKIQGPYQKITRMRA